MGTDNTDFFCFIHVNQYDPYNPCSIFEHDLHPFDLPSVYAGYQRMEPAIQLATQDDIDKLLAFSRQLYKDDPSATGDAHFDKKTAHAALQEFVDNPALGRAWLIYDEDEPIGYVILTLGYSLEYHGRDAFIDELFIAAEYRGRGIGKYVIQFVEDKARKLGVNALHLEVERANNRAKTLYHKIGFEDHKRHLLTKWLEKPLISKKNVEVLETSKLQE